MKIIEEDYSLLFEAYQRLQKNGEQEGISIDEVMSHHGITQNDLDEMEDVRIESATHD